MAPSLKKIIILSDIHLTSDGKKIADLDPLNKLDAAINHLIEKHKDLWTDEMDKYKDIGGVRIEDDIVVKKDGYQQLN